MEEEPKSGLHRGPMVRKILVPGQVWYLLSSKSSDGTCLLSSLYIHWPSLSVAESLNLQESSLVHYLGMQ